MRAAEVRIPKYEVRRSVNSTIETRHSDFATFAIRHSNFDISASGRGEVFAFSQLSTKNPQLARVCGNGAAKSAFEIGFIFNRFTLGDECMQRLGFAEEQYADWNFNLLEELRFYE